MIVLVFAVDYHVYYSLQYKCFRGNRFMIGSQCSILVDTIYKHGDYGNIVVCAGYDAVSRERLGLIKEDEVMALRAARIMLNQGEYLKQCLDI